MTTGYATSRSQTLKLRCKIRYPKMLEANACQPDHVAALAERRPWNSSHCLRVSAKNRKVLCRFRSLVGNR